MSSHADNDAIAHADVWEKMLRCKTNLPQGAFGKFTRTYFEAQSMIREVD